MTEYACPRRELSCIVGNLFVELEPPCDHCAAGDSLTICGTTYAGTRATLTVTEYGFTFDGPNLTLQTRRNTANGATNRKRR